MLPIDLYILYCITFTNFFFSSLSTMQNTFDFISSLLARWLAGIPDTVDYCVYYYMRLEHTHRTKTNEEWFHLLHSLFVWCTNENIFLLTSLTMRRVKQKNNNNLYLFHTDIEFCPILSDQCTHLRDIPSRIVVLCRRCRYRRRSYVRTIRSSFYFFASCLYSYTSSFTSAKMELQLAGIFDALLFTYICVSSADQWHR